MTPLSTEEIKGLIAFDKHKKMKVESNIKEAFTREETIQILNAVSDHKTVTEDGKWRIKYMAKGRFWLRANDSTLFGFPCGNFTIERVLEQLTL